MSKSKTKTLGVRKTVEILKANPKERKAIIDEEALKQKAQEDQAAQKELAEMMKAIETVCDSGAGISVLREIMSVCQFGESSATINPVTGELMANNTIFRDGRQYVWLHFRKFIPADKLVLIEHPKVLSVQKA